MYNLLQGVRILDLTSVVLGPYATQFMGDFGADVIKVEPPGGDLFRYAGPSRSHGMGAGFLNFNRNKRSVVLDLKAATDRERFEALLKDADVLVHNMRPDAAERLGLSPETVAEKYPRVVYCVSSGFGRNGRNVDQPAYDDIIQAAAGVAHLNADQNGAPRFLPNIICDKVAGMHLAVAILAGVAHQAKTGSGCFIEAPMFESVVSFLMAEQLAGETFVPARGTLGYDRLMSPNRRPFPTKDGYLAVLPYNSRHWHDFLTFIGEGELAQADWVHDSARRSEEIGTLYDLVAEVMPTRETAEWLSILAELDIPCSTINSFHDLLEHGHLADVGMFPNVDHATEGSLRAIRSPFWVRGVDAEPDVPAPFRNADPVVWK